MQTNFYFEKASICDVDEIALVYEMARRFMASCHLNQWQDGYPNGQSAERDIKMGVGRVLKDNGQIVGVASFLPYESDYDQIYVGDWICNGKYMVVHRVAVRDDFRSKGIASRLLVEAEREARASGCVSLRIDTHEDNLPMRRMLEKNGFCYCGKIFLKRNAEWRVGYEKKI